MCVCVCVSHPFPPFLSLTRQRAAAFGFLAAMGRIGAILGNIVFGEMSDRQPTLPLILTGAMLGGGGLLCFFLKETRNAHIL